MNDRIPHPLDVDDTGSCPVAVSCAGCGARRDLAVATAGTPLGVFCLTLCGSCAETGELPHHSFVLAAGAVMEHCDHLDCDLDEMAAVLAGETR